MIDIILIIGAYLLGSLSSAIILCRLLGLPDPRQQGSGNPGATNVLRYGGKKTAALVLLGDVLKGIIPVLLVKAIGGSDTVIAGVAFAAFTGHLYPIYFGFEGGKGVATAFGVLSALIWQVGVALLVMWLMIAAIFRYSSLAALTAAVSAPGLVYYFSEIPIYWQMTAVIAVLLILRHHSNIRNLLTGRESRIGARKS
jgi:glycerol-3-phosphate acyltransferase PlsY